MARRLSRNGCSTVSASSSAMTSRCRPASHVGVDARLERGQAQLGEAGDLAVEEAVSFDVGVGMATPHRQRVAQPSGDIVRSPPWPTADRYASSNATASIVAAVQSRKYASPWRTITSPSAWRRFDT